MQSVTCDYAQHADDWQSAFGPDGKESTRMTRKSVPDATTAAIPSQASNGTP
jgi:hypothetical protein